MTYFLKTRKSGSMCEESAIASATHVLSAPRTQTKQSSAHSFRVENLQAGLRLLRRARRIADDDNLLSVNAEKNSISSKSPRNSTTRLQSTTNLSASNNARAASNDLINTPSKFAHFELLEKLGQGAFGTVWKARDTFLDREVAVKLPHPTHLAGHDTSQILREARTAAKIKHPNIVQVHEIGKEGEATYIVSDFVKGQTLTDWLRTSHTDAGEAAGLVMTIAAALDVAHSAGIVHRDIKPDNIMIDECSQPRIMDFGLAKQVTDGPTLTLQGNVVGTPSYMAPEQARGDSHHCDARTDIYAVGVLLYEILTGEAPFRGELESILLQTIHDEPAPPRKLNRNIPPDLETICLKCLEKEPSQRFASARDLADELSRFLSGRPIVSRRIGLFGRTIKWSRRNRLASAFLLITIASLVTGSIVSASFAWQNHKSLLQIEKEKSLVLEKSRTLETALARAEIEKQRATDRLGYAKLGLYNASLAEVETIWKVDPRRAQQILIDQRRCPAECRDFSWDLYYSYCETPAERTIDFDREIEQFAISPDNAKAAASYGTTIVLHTERNGQASPFTLNGHTDEVTDLAFSPNNQILASGSRNGTVLLWDCNSGELLRSIRPKNGAINSFAFSPNSKQLAIVVEGFIHRGGMGTWSIWDTESGETVVGPKLRLAFEPMIVRYSPNGKHIAIAGRDRSIQVFATTSGERVGNVPKQEHGIRDMIYSNDDTLIVGRANLVNAWDIEQKRNVFIKTVGSKNIMSLSVTADGSRILVRSAYDDYLRILDVESSKVQPVIWNRPGIPFFACFANGDAQVVTAVVSGRVEWRSHKTEFRGEVVKPEPWDETSVDSIDIRMALAIDGRNIISQKGNGKFVQMLHRSTGTMNCFDVSPNGNELVTGSENKVGLWNLSSNQSSVVGNHAATVEHVEFSTDGTVVVSAGRDNRILVWHKSDRTLQQNVKVDHPIVGLALSSNRNLLACAHADLVVIRQLSDMKVIATMRGSQCFREIAWSPDGKSLAAGSVDGRLIVWDADGTLRAVRIAHFGTCQSVAFSQDGKTIATSGEKNVRLWDGQTILPRIKLPTANHSLRCLKFAPNVKQLIGMTESGTVVSWEPNRELDRPVAAFGSDNVVPNDLALSHNDTTLAATGDDGMLRAWDVRTGKLRCQTEPIADKTTCVAFAENNSKVFVGSTSCNVVEVNLDSPSHPEQRMKHAAYIRSISAANHGSIVALDGMGQMSSTISNSIKQNDLSHIRFVSMAENGSRLAMGDRQGKVVVRNVSSKSNVFRLPTNERKLSDIHLSSNGKQLVIAYYGESGEIEVWDVDLGVRTNRFEANRAIRQAYICQQRNLLWTCEGHVLVARDLKTDRVKTQLIGGSYISRFVVFHNDSRAIVAYGDGSILLWDVPSSCS